MGFINIGRTKRIPIDAQDVEIVERKCIGHPDTICDALSEEASRALSSHYLGNFGSVLHHNVDKALLVAGRSRPCFGGGDVIKPIKVIIAGRATGNVGDRTVPVDDIVKKAAEDYIKTHLKAPLEHFEIISEVHPGAANLTDVVSPDSIPVANDTSFGTGYAPLSRTEKFVLKVTDIVRDPGFREQFPEVGDDIKIMALRKDDVIKLTVAMGFIDAHIKDSKDYFEKKERVRQELLERIGRRHVEIDINTWDDPKSASVDDAFITVTGTSAEMGDDGETGRGNRVNGLITPNRPVSLEAAAGKNPVSHVGKIYNVLARGIAEDIVDKLEGCVVREAYVTLLSQIGKPIDRPEVLDVELNCEDITEDIKTEVNSICESHLKSLPELKNRIIAGKVRVY